MKQAYGDTRAVMAQYTDDLKLVQMTDWMYFERLKSIAANMHSELKSLAELYSREMEVVPVKPTKAGM